jgi:hypothetical protein
VTLGRELADMDASPLEINLALLRRVVPGMLVTFLLAFLAYVYTAAPSCGQGHDTGELTAAAWLPGVAHPPGYPLYVFQGYLWRLIVPGDPGWVMNINSGFSLAVGVAFLSAALSLVSRPLVGSSCALLFAFCTAVWRQAVAAEVFALHLMIMSILLLIALLWQIGTDTQRKVLIGLGAAMIGFSFAHHHTVVMAGPACLLYAILARGKGRLWGFTLWVIPIFLLCGGIPYFLLYLLAKTSPKINWGNPSNWDNMWFHILRKAYGTGRLNPVGSETHTSAGDAQVKTYFVTLISNQYVFPSILLLPIGLDRCLVSKRFAHLALFGGIAFVYGPFFAKLGNQPTEIFFSDLMERFYCSSLIGVAGLTAVGFESVFQWLEGRRLRAVAVALCLGLPLFSFLSNFDKANQRGVSLALDHSRGMLKFLPKDSLFFIVGDLNTGMFDYLHYVTQERPDVVLVCPGLVAGDMKRDDPRAWFAASLPDELRDYCLDRSEARQIDVIQSLMLHARAQGRRVFYNYPIDKTLNPGHYARYGPVWEFLPVDGPDFTPAEIRKNCLDVLDSLESHFNNTPPKQSPHHNFWVTFFLSTTLESYAALEEVLKSTDPEKAVVCLDRMISIEHPPQPKHIKERAALEFKLGRMQAAKEDFERVLEFSPRDEFVLAGLVSVSRQMKDATSESKYLAQLKLMQQKQPAGEVQSPDKTDRSLELLSIILVLVLARRVLARRLAFGVSQDLSSN